MVRRCVHDIDTKGPVNSSVVMNTRQPDSITIDGVELPTMKKAFAFQRKLERQTRQRDILFFFLVILMLAGLIVLAVK